MSNIMSFEELKNKRIKKGQNEFEKAFDLKSLMDYLAGDDVSEKEIEEILQAKREIEDMLSEISKEDENEIIKKMIK